MRGITERAERCFVFYFLPSCVLIDSVMPPPNPLTRFLSIQCQTPSQCPACLVITLQLFGNELLNYYLGQTPTQQQAVNAPSTSLWRHWPQSMDEDEDDHEDDDDALFFKSTHYAAASLWLRQHFSKCPGSQSAAAAAAAKCHSGANHPTLWNPPWSITSLIAQGGEATSDRSQPSL